MEPMNHAFRMLMFVACTLGALALAGCAATKGAPVETNCHAEIRWEVVKASVGLFAGHN
jgi:hypothetical protein